MDVAVWLRDQGLERYENAFSENNVDAEILLKLTSEDLKEIGVIPVGDRRRLLDAIASLAVAPTVDVAGAPTTATEIKPARGEAERRQLTVMFADLAGSTELARKLDPEDLATLIRAYQARCAEVIERWGGRVAKYMGDGVLAYFGWPQAHEDDPERAVRAGLALVEAVADQMTPDGKALAVRVGIATGLVMVGDLIGEGAAQENAVVGETPNLAARLQGLAEAGAVVVALDTRTLLRGVFDLHDLGEHHIKGFEGPVGAWQVAGEAASESRFEARTQQMTPLVGRDDEVEILRRRWRRAREGEGQVVLMTGEPGIGKSRLAATLREMIAQEPHMRLTYQCSPHHSESAFHPVIRQLERAANIRPEQGWAERLDRLEALLVQSGDASEEPVRLLASLLSIPVEPTTNLGAQELKERTLRALVGQLEGLATVWPVLVVFEDLHWADPSTLELLDRLVERVESLPILVLLTARPGFAATWTDQAHVTLLTLNRIDKRESRTLLESLVGEEAVPDELAEEITARSDGIPLFVEEMTRAVLESRRADGDATAARSYMAVPASLQDSLMARLDRLGTGKRVAQFAAAIGRDFTTELLEPVCDLPRAELDRAMDELVEAGVISRRGGAAPSYVFKHALVQDAAYNSLLRTSRRQLHERIADALSERLADEPAVLAHHWECAGNLDQALACRLGAAERAAARSAKWEATAHYWRVLELLQQLPESEDTKHHHLTTLLALLSLGGDFWQTEAEQARGLRHIERAIEIASDDGNAAALARLKAYQGDKFLNEALLMEALQHASDSGDERVRAEVETRYGGYHGMLGRFEESLSYVERAVEIYAELGANVQQGLLMAGNGRCYSARAGSLERSFYLARRARTIAETTGDLGWKSWLAMEAEPCLYKGLWQRTVDVVDQELPAAWEIGNWSVILWSSGWATIAEVKLGRLQAAHGRIEAAFKKAGPRSPNPFARAYPLITRGHVRLAEGELAAALDTAREASEMAERAAATMEQGAAHRLLAQIHEARGDGPAAEAAHRQSLDILGAIQSRPELAQSLLAYGRFTCADNPDEGSRLLGQALALFEDMEATGWIAETRAALEA